MHVWNESFASRGAQEVGSCLLKYIATHKINKKLIVWSNSCGGQSRNFKMASIWMYLVQNPENAIGEIVHKFPEPGHSFPPNDSEFGDIEKKLRYHPEVHVPSQWTEIIEKSRMKKMKFEVVRMESKDFKSAKVLEEALVNRKKSLAGNQLQWLRIKEMRFLTEKPGIMEFKYTHNEIEEYSQVNFSKRQRMVILHARGRNGFIPGVLFVTHQSMCDAPADYRGTMNYKIFEEWFEECLLKLLEEPSVIIMDNAPYHAHECSLQSSEGRDGNAALFTWNLLGVVCLLAPCVIPYFHSIPRMPFGDAGLGMGGVACSKPEYTANLSIVSRCGAVDLEVRSARSSVDIGRYGPPAGDPAAGSAARLPKPAAAAAECEGDAGAEQQSEGPVARGATLRAQRAAARPARGRAPLHALPRLRRADVPRRHVRHASSRQQGVHHVVPGWYTKFLTQNYVRR
ncbi:hypothetical protein ANN_22482 [Periplaneta americana]|uniref:Tc1-like transposase DDE domain-containing protein n=1 Tax=Periplaneta americana TaxID=6978 RepID=A0ABQ8S8E6_PERAM|nr:hypothetical protein ANN_22482 [Periplaneta americana]